MHPVVMALEGSHPNPGGAAVVGICLKEGDVAQLDRHRRVLADQKPHEKPGPSGRWTTGTGPRHGVVPAEVARFHIAGPVAASRVVQAKTEAGSVCCVYGPQER